MNRPHRTLVVETKDGVLHLKGSITEESDLKPIALHQGALRLNMGQLTTINSSGVRLFLNILTSRGGPVEYAECRPNFVELLNIVPALYPQGSSLKSIYIDHECPSCDHEQTVLVTKEELHQEGRNISLMSYKCPHCAAPLVTDRTPEELLHFLVA